MKLPHSQCKRIRVGYVFNHAGVVGGGEISFVDLIDAVRGHGVEPVAFVPGQGEVAARLSGLGVRWEEVSWPAIRVNTLPYYLKEVSRLTRAFKEMGLDLVHANGARCMLYAGPAARRAGIPCVWHVRVLDRDPLLDRIRGYYSSAVVANSNAMAATLKPMIRGREKIHVVYNGFDLEKIVQAPPLDIHHEFWLPPGPVVLGVGRFTRCKRFEDLISACGQLEGQGLQLSLLLVGAALPREMAYERELRDLAKRVNLRAVHFAGWREDVASIMKSADLFVLPSRAESFGRVIVEAWACGLPVVASAGGGPAEIITCGQNGLLTVPGDIGALAGAIESLVTDETRRRTLAAAGREESEKFSLSEHAGSVVQFYRRVPA